LAKEKRAPQDDGLKSGYRIHPIAYGIKAFDLGGHGMIEPLAIANPDALNLTAYAVREGRSLFVTVINKKDPGAGPRDANVTIAVHCAAGGAMAVFLTAPHDSVSATDGITLGGASIHDGSWDGKWITLTPHQTGAITVRVPGASAAIIKLSLEGTE
jgi:hypothetical protein